MKAVKICEDNDALKKTNLSAKVIAHIKAFEEYLVADGKASKTLDSYLFDVKEFMNYLAAQGVTDVSKIKRIHVTDFITTLLFALAQTVRKLAGLPDRRLTDIMTLS